MCLRDIDIGDVGKYDKAGALCDYYSEQSNSDFTAPHDSTAIETTDDEAYDLAGASPAGSSTKEYSPAELLVRTSIILATSQDADVVVYSCKTK